MVLVQSNLNWVQQCCWHCSQNNLNRPRSCQTASKAGKDTAPCYLFKQQDSNPLQRCWWADTMSMVAVSSTSAFWLKCLYHLPSLYIGQGTCLAVNTFFILKLWCFKCWGQERNWLLSYFTLLSLYEPHLHPVTCHNQLLWQERKFLSVPTCQFIYSIPRISVWSRNCRWIIHSRLYTLMGNQKWNQPFQKLLFFWLLQDF